MVDRERAPARTAPAAAIGVASSAIDGESHDTPVRDTARVDGRDRAPDAEEQLASLFTTDPSGEADTRRVSSYPLPADDPPVVAIPPLRSLDPSLEFAEVSWPEELDLAEHGPGANVNDVDDVDADAGTVRIRTRPARVPVAPMSAPGEEPATLRKAPSVRAMFGEGSERPPAAAGSGDQQVSEPAPPLDAGASAPLAREPTSAPSSTASGRAGRVLMYVVMTLLGGGIAAVIHAPRPRPKEAQSVVVAPPMPPIPTVSALLASAPPPPAPPPPPSAAEEASPRAAVTADEAMPPGDEAEAAAVDALGRLREGVGNCVRQGIGGLPGSSPAVPRLLTMTRAPGFLALAPDWNSAFWSCARFRIVGPMRFQLQWQILKPSAEGLGVAWIDRDGDGTPDRVYAFRATMAQGKGEVQLGEIAPIAAAHPQLPVGY